MVAKDAKKVPGLHGHSSHDHFVICKLCRATQQGICGPPTEPRNPVQHGGGGRLYDSRHAGPRNIAPQKQTAETQ